jgi:hypothetical protein
VCGFGTETLLLLLGYVGGDSREQESPTGLYFELTINSCEKEGRFSLCHRQQNVL